MSRIAVVIPSFQHGRYLAETLASALDQTRRPDRVIVVDDGSTDDSRAILRRVANPRVTVILQENAGAHAAIARGITEAADCDLVAILNSDDHFLPDRLAVCEAALERDSACQLVCTGLRMIDDNGAPLDEGAPRRRWLETAWAAADLEHPERWLGFANFAATTSNFVARTPWLHRHPPLPYRYVHDYDMLVRAAVGGGLRILPDVLLEYRVHATNTISAAPEKIVREVLAMNLRLAADLAPALRTSPEVRAAWGRYLAAAASNISSFRFELFAAAAAEAVARSAGAVEWPGEPAVAVPEFQTHPNTALIGESPGAVSGRLQELKTALREASRSRKDLERMRDWHRTASGSAWVTCGIALGAVPAAAQARTARELATATAASPWIALGARLGVTACARLLERSAAWLER